jgi:hypothetical protein
MTTRKEIIDAYTRIRTIDNTIPDHVLDFMKEASFKLIENNKIVNDTRKILEKSNHKMDLNKLFEVQMRENFPVTEEILGKFSSKTYFNGEDIKIGEKVLFSMIVGDVIELEEGSAELPIKFGTINEKHFDLFIPYCSYSKTDIPSIKLKS